MSPEEKALKPLFSKYIRKRDAVDGYCKCFTCDSVLHWKDGDCGHFIATGNSSKAVVYDTQNAHFQCRVCNRDKRESKEVKKNYRNNMILKYGEKSVSLLEEKAYKLEFRKTDFKPITDFCKKGLLEL